MNCDFLVTGGAMGIGLAFCKRILSGGGRVCMADIDVVKGEQTTKELQKEFGEKRMMFVKLDVRDQEEWRTVWEQAEQFFGGQVEGFCNNAGIFHHTDWMKVKAINMDGMLYGAMLAFEKMGVSHGGRGGVMVITGSMNSFVNGSFDTVEQQIYGTTKHGVQGLVRGLATKHIYEINKVRTLAICPWFVDTNLVQTNINAEKMKQINKMNRVLTPDEVGFAFERLVVEGRTGDMVAVMPGANFFWPNVNRDLVKYYYIGAKVARKVLGIEEERIITSNDFKKLAIILLIAAFLLFHVILSWIGL